MTWEPRPNYVQDRRIDWTNFVWSESDFTSEKLSGILSGNPEITFYFICKENFTLNLPSTNENRLLRKGDALFFKGKPSLVWSGVSDAYVLMPPMLKMKSGDYVTIPWKEAYSFGTGAFSVMAFITPKVMDTEGKTVLKTGPVFSSRYAETGKNWVLYGGWALYIYLNDDKKLILGFTTQAVVSGQTVMRCLEAPINSIYDDKDLRMPTGHEVDLERSGELFKEYTHLVAAVRGPKGEMSLFLNGYLLAREISSVKDMSTELVGLFKESIDKPNRFFYMKRLMESNSFGTLELNTGSASQLISSTSSSDSKVCNLSTTEQDKHDIASIGIKEKTTGFYHTLTHLFVKPVKSQNEKLLASYAFSMWPACDVTGSILNTKTVNIGRTDWDTKNVNVGAVYEGFIKHVSLWNTALSQADIISYMDKEKKEEDSTNCVGFWKLESDYKDSSQQKNHGSAGGTPEFVYQDKVLPVYIEEQHKTQWCWAATALSIVEFYDPMSQTTQKNIVDTQANHTQAADPDYDNKPGSTLDYLVHHTKHLRASYDRDLLKLASAINCEQGSNPDLAKKFVTDQRLEKMYTYNVKQTIDYHFLKIEINNYNPVCVAVRWWDSGHSGELASEGKPAIPAVKAGFNAGGHIMVLTGIDQKTEKLIINDPWSGVIYISIQEFAKGNYPGKGYWYQTITTCSNNGIGNSQPVS